MSGRHVDAIDGATEASDAAASVDLVVRAAAAAGVERSSRVDRAGWLRALAAELELHRDELVALAREETHLSESRLRGEVARTATQLRFFAGVIEEGSYLEATLDAADASLVPPRPDLRRMLRPIGPVAVFAASNFPFAFSVLGNDTASALAAGCPVVVKAHPGHPRLSRRVAELAREALQAADAPADALVLVEGVEAGIALVGHPLISAVGFTGSTRGGRALFDLACARPAPIPFYGELGSLNPVVVTEAAVVADVAGIAAGLAGSFTRDGGQYCTKPGLVFVPDAAGFEDALCDALGTVGAQRLLTRGIGAAFAAGADRLIGLPDAELVWRGAVMGSAAGDSPDSGEGTPDAPATVVAAPAAALAADPDAWLQECFGPLTVLVRYRDRVELDAALAALEGSLTASIHHAPGEDVSELVATLDRTAGRLVFNGWPTGVAIAWAQHHGGRWPATTASVHTSVGATAIRRFLTPVAYQDAPAAVLPAELADGNPHGIPRRVDGTLLPRHQS
jgi:NADP-dependent aldehyde dehydrogenase